MYYKQQLDFHGRKIRLRTDCAPLAERLRAHWLTQGWAPESGDACDAEIVIEKAGAGNFPGMKAGALDRVSILAATANYSASLDTRGPSWQGLIQFRQVRDWDGFLIRIFAPFLAHVLRRMNFFELHSGAVVLGSQGVMIPAKMGCGKTTTVVSLIRGGFEYIADDHLYLRSAEGGVEILGYPKHPALLDDAVERFPELHFLKQTEDIFRGKRRKKLLPLEQLEGLYGPRRLRAPLKMILFPRVDLRRRVSLQPLTATEAMLWMMRQEPWDHHGPVKDPANVAKQMALFKTIAQSVPAYILYLNPEITEIPKVVRQALESPGNPIASEPRSNYAFV